MAVRPILELPHPALRQRAKKVRKIDSSIVRLASDMVDTMRDAGGIGLAANQIGVLRRVIVVQLPDDEKASVYINPEIVHREGQREVEEGCLSIPGYKGFITRSIWVKFKALDDTSKLVRLKADGLLSQALEHEVDHLNGILYIDHFESHQELIPVETQPDLEADPEDTGVEPAAVPGRGSTLVNGRGQVAEPQSDPQETPASLRVR